MPNDLICSICQQLSIDPCNIGDTQCQHIFCKICIKRHNTQHKMRNINIDSIESTESTEPTSENTSKGATCPVCDRPIASIILNKDKMNHIKQLMPLILYKQRIIQHIASVYRQNIVKIHNYMAEALNF